MTERPQAGATPDAGSVGGAVAGLVLGVAAFLLLDLLVFRSGLYVRIASPDSYAGMVYATELGSRVRDPAREILVLGSSRTGEGFSAARAEELLAPEGPAFFNAAIPGATPRVLSYLLRRLDPGANRYAVVAIELPAYDDQASSEPLADRQLDLAFLPDLVGWGDCAELTRSYTTGAGRAEALATCLFKGYAYRRDVQDLLAAPLARLRAVRAARAHGYEWARAYDGHPGSLEGARFDEAQGRLVYDASVPDDVRRQLEAGLRQKGARADERAYRLAWLGEIARRYAGSSTRLVLFQPPRSPFPAALRPRASAGAVRALVASGRMAALDEQLFEPLERPEYFFDLQHLDREGRRVFTERLARALVPLAPPVATGAAAGRAD